MSLLKGCKFTLLNKGTSRNMVIINIVMIIIITVAPDAT